MIPTTAEEAYEYINSRYVFTAEHYPILAKLTPDEQTWFAVNHGLSHIGKSIRLVRRCETLNQSHNEANYHMRRIKLLTNVIKLAESVGISKDEFANLRPDPNEDSVYYTLTRIIDTMTEELDTLCEAFDHGKPLNRKGLRRAVEQAWQSLMSSRTAFRCLPTETHMRKAYEEIPKFMISK